MAKSPRLGRLRLRFGLMLAVVFGLLLFTRGDAVLFASQSAAKVDARLFQGLRYRSIGPARGGRVTAVAGHRRQPNTFYMGATGGGVWKTTDAGQSWQNVSDGFFETASIGAIAVAESDPNVVYVGTGSAAIRSNVILGRGVYKSTDAGKTWTHIGLRDAGQIGSVKVDPRDASVAYVAALGQPFGANAERGVFKTKDGGKSWQKVLFINDRTGAVSLAMSPTNPNELYAGSWQAVRKPWTIVSGGPAAECGIYKSSDGGETWRHLENGLPKGLIGKIGLDISAADPKRVYALMEASEGQGGVYRSDDSGASWALINKTGGLIARPFYYTYINADPKNADAVYVNNLGFYKSTDGGKSFRPIGTPHGDNQGMWINPDNPEIFIQSNDGGANVTLNGGRSWSTIYNQPTAEIYAVAVDNQFPYSVYGAQQDNTTLIVPSLPSTMERADDPIQLWKQGPGCETGPIMPSPLNPNIVYGACKGEFYRTNFETGQTVSYWVHPQNRYGHNPKDILYRFQRVSPIEVSPHNPRVLYHCSHVVHRSTDEGVTWTVVSPDLTANEPDKQVISGEPITRDITGEEVYSTIYAFRESTLEAGVLWSGANDGPVHISRDNGKSWKNVTPKSLPAGGRVQNIEPSPHRKGSAYIAVYRYLLNDWQPYIYATNDYGATWTRLTDGKNGIPANFTTRVVREDPDREGLLYAGTDFGMFISFDNGKSWQPFQLNLPVTPITDIRVHQKDLVISTMGRAFWILDNVSPLHQITDAVATSAATLFKPATAIRTRRASGGGGRSGGASPEYPAPAAVIDYVLAVEPAGELKLEILDAADKVIRTVTSRAGQAAPAGRGVMQGDEDEMRGPRFGGAAASLTKRAGHNRFAWDFRYDGFGPLALPGKYKVRLSADSWNQTQPLEVTLDPRLAKDGVTVADLKEQLDLLLAVRETTSDARRTLQRIDGAIQKAAGTDKLQKLQALRSQLATAPITYPQPMLIDQLGALSRMAGSADRKVGRSTLEYFEVLKKRLTEIKNEARTLAPE
ncbi:MAG: WD40/YVTN/BNR-like repeat-containing protein [Blastocatellia bacterium]